MSDGGSESFDLRVDNDGVARVTFDQPDSKVNLFDSSTMEELDRLLGDLESRISTGRVVAILFRSGKPDSFVAGADVREIADLRTEEEGTRKSREGQRIFRRLDRLNVPTVAAVHGTCLGGGTEMILACDYRVASRSEETAIGLPEVKLGILPGFGGTTRLPRLCGIRHALDLVLTGEPADAGKAERIGLVQRTVDAEDFDDGVEAFLHDVLGGQVARGGHRKALWERLLEDTSLGRDLLFWFVRRQTLKRTEGNYPAPIRALEAVRETYTLSLDDALRRESEILGELAMTPESKNLTRIFLLRMAARRALSDEARAAGHDVEKVAVVGAGVMGGAIAELAAVNDVPVVLKDIEQGPLDDGLRHARELLGKAARKGVFPENEVDLKFAEIEGTLSYEAFEDVDLVIEAVVEKMAVKKQVLRESEEVLPETAVFSTNTSSLSVSELAEASERPGRVVGLHFFNPVHRMPLVEIVRPEGVSDEAVATVFGFAVAMGKTPVLVRDGPGFLVNRLLAPYLNEAGYLLEEGAGVRAVDQALSDFGMPMGPCRLLDEVGLDIAHHVSQVMTDAFGERMKSPGLVDRLLEDGRLGKKGGLGFYVYDDGKEKKVDPQLRKVLPRPEKTPPDADEVRRRCLYLMVNEAAYALEDGVVEDAGSVDLGLVLGTGFPPFRGGILRWADREGLPTIVEGLEELREEAGERFRPAPLLARKAEKGRTFTDPVLG